MILYIKQTDFSLKTAVILLIFNTRVIVMKISILDYVIVQKISKIKHEYQTNTLYLCQFETSQSISEHGRKHQRSYIDTTHK